MEVTAHPESTGDRGRVRNCQVCLGEKRQAAGPGSRARKFAKGRKRGKTFQAGGVWQAVRSLTSSR